MQSKNNTTQGLLKEMGSKKIKAPQIERISSLDGGRTPVMIFNSRGKVARRPVNISLFDTYGDDSVNGKLETGSLNQRIDNDNTGSNRHVNGKITTNGVIPGSLSSSTETISKLRRPAPSPPVSNQPASAVGNSLVSARALSLSSSLQSLNNKLPLESDIKVKPPLIPAPKSFLQRQSSLSSSTSSLSSFTSLQTPPTTQLQPVMTKQQYSSDLSLPPPPPDANNNSEVMVQASVANEEYQELSDLTTTKKTRAPGPPILPSPPPPPSPQPLIRPLSPLPSESSSPSSTASSSPLNRFQFPPPPTTPPSPMEIPETYTSFTSTSVSSSALLSSGADRDKDRKRTLSPNEVMDYFDEAIGDQAVSASSYNNVPSYPEFSPVFHFPSVSDDKLQEPVLPRIDTSTRVSSEVRNVLESTETTEHISTVSYPKDRNSQGNDSILQTELGNDSILQTELGNDSILQTELGNDSILQTELSYSESKQSDGNYTQDQGDKTLLSPKSEEERKKRGSANSRTVAVSKLRPEVTTVRQYIKPGTVDVLASLFASMKDEHITSPGNKNEFDFNFRETLDKLESVDKGADIKSPVMRNAKRSTILGPNELFPRLQGSVSAESLQERPKSQHSPAYSKVNQWPRLYQASSAHSLYSPPTLPDPQSTQGFDFLAASREIHKHVVLIRSNSRAGVTANNKVNDVSNDSSKILDSVSISVDNALENGSKSPINSQELNNHLTEDTAGIYNAAQENVYTPTLSSVTEASRRDSSHSDSVMISSELLKHEADSFNVATERQDVSAFPPPTVTPTNSKNSSRRSSLADDRRSEVENHSIHFSLNEQSAFPEMKRPGSSRGSSRSNSPITRNSSKNSSRRSSLEDNRKKEDTSNYSVSVDLEGTPSPVVTRRPGGSRSSSGSNSPDRQQDVEKTHSLNTADDDILTATATAATSSFSRRSSSRSSSMKSETSTGLISHKLNSSSGSSASASPANSKNSSRAGSVRRSGDVDEESTDYKSFAVENVLASKVRASDSPSIDTNIKTADLMDRMGSSDNHSHATFDDTLLYSHNVSSVNRNDVKVEHEIVDSHIRISEDYRNTAELTNATAHSSRSSSRSGSLKITDSNNDANLQLPDSAYTVAVDTVAVSAVSPTSSSSSSRSSSPEKRSTEDVKATINTSNNVFLKRDSMSSSSRRSSQANDEKINSDQRISRDYENIAVLAATSPASSRSSSSQSGSVNTRSNEGEVNLELPSSTVATVAVESRAVESRAVESRAVESRAVESRTVESRTVESRTVESRAVAAASPTSSGSSSRSSSSSSPDRHSGSQDILQFSDSAFENKTGINSTPERSRRNIQVDEDRVGSDKNIPEDYGHVTVVTTTAGSISSRSSSRSGSLKIKDKANEVHLEFPSHNIEPVAVHAAKVSGISHTGSGSSSRSGSPDRKESSEDVIQSFDKAFVHRRASISSNADSSKNSSLAGSLARDRERETNIETNLTPLDDALTDRTGFLKIDTKSENESEGCFSVDIENKNTARSNISPSSSKSSSREGSLERKNTHDLKPVGLNTAPSTPSSSRSSSRAGSVLNTVSGNDSQSLGVALGISFGFTVKSTNSSTSSKSRSSSVNRDDNQELDIHDQHEAFQSTVFPSFHSSNRQDDGTDDFDHKLLKDISTIEPVSSGSSSRSSSPTKNDSLESLRKEYHHMDLENQPIPSSASAAGSQKSSRKSSPERNKTTSVEHYSQHSEIHENTFAVTDSPTSSRRSSQTNAMIGYIPLEQEQNEVHMTFKSSASSSNSPASSRRSSSSIEAESSKLNPQLNDDTVYLDSRQLEDTHTLTVFDSSSVKHGQSHDDVSHAAVSIFNSTNIATTVSPVSSSSSQTNYLHNDGLKNQKADTASLTSKSSSSSSATTPAGSRRVSQDGDSIKDIESNHMKPVSDLTTTDNVDAGSFTDIDVPTRSRDSSPDGSLKRTKTWDNRETDSYQLALQNALDSTIPTTTSSRRDSQVSFVKRNRKTSQSSSDTSKNSSRSGSSTRSTGSDLNQFNVTLMNTPITPIVGDHVSSSRYTDDINNITSTAFTQSEKEVDDHYSVSLPNTENLDDVSTSVTRDINYTLKHEDATLYDISDTKGTQHTHSETHVNTTEGKHFNMFHNEAESKHLDDAQLKDSYSTETFLPPPDGEIFDSNVHFSEKENISSIDSMFHLPRFNSNNADHAEVSQSMSHDMIDRSSFSASAGMYSQHRVTDDRDEITSVTLDKNKDDSSDDGKVLLDTDDELGVEYIHTVVDIHSHDKEDTMSQISTLSQFGSDRDMVIHTRDHESDSSDSDNSSNRNSFHAGYTVNEVPDETSDFTVQTEMYSFRDFKDGIARTSSNQLSSSHDGHEGSVPAVIPNTYETDSVVAFSEKETSRGSRRSSSSSDVSANDDKRRPTSETFKHEHDYEIFQKTEGKTHVFTRQGNFTSQISEDLQDKNGESFQSLMTSHTDTILHTEAGQDTGSVSTNSVVMQLLAETDASASTTAIDSATFALRGDKGVTEIPVTDHSLASQSKNFLSVLDDINIDTDITSRFLRRSSRFSGTYSPEKRQSSEVKSEPEDDNTQTHAAVVPGTSTEETLTNASLLLNYQTQGAAYTAEVGNQEPATGFSVNNDFTDNDITLSGIASELKHEAFENKEVNYSESMNFTLNDEMHDSFDRVHLVTRKDSDIDVNVDYDTNADHVSRDISVDEIIHSSVKNTEETQRDLFGSSTEADAAVFSTNGMELDSLSVDEMKTGVVESRDFVADVSFNNTAERMYVNDNLPSLAGETDVKKNEEDDPGFAFHVDNELQNEYMNDSVYRSVGELTTEETDTGSSHYDFREDKQQVHSYVSDIIQHSVDKINTDEIDRSNLDTDWKVDVRDDKEQVHSYVSDIIQHSVDTTSTEEIDRSNLDTDWKVDVRDDKEQVHSYVSDIIQHSVDTSTEEIDRTNLDTDWKVDVRDDKEQVHSYVSDIIQHSADTISTEEIYRSNLDTDWKVDVRDDKEQVHSYVSDIIQHSVDTTSTEEIDRSNLDTDWKVDVRDDKEQVHSYVSDIIQHSADTISTEEIYRSNLDTNWKVDVRDDKEQVHSYVSDIIQHSVDTTSTEEIDRSNLDTDWKVDVRDDKEQVHSYVSDIIQHSADTTSTEKIDRSNLDTDWKVDVRDDKEQVHSYVSDIIQHSVNTPSTEEIDRTNLDTDWKVDVRDDKEQVHSYVSDIIQHSADTISTEEIDKTSEHSLGENTIHYESVAHMDAGKRSSDVHLDFNEGYLFKDHSTHDATENIPGHSIDEFSIDVLKKENHLGLDEEKHSVDTYVNDIIHHSIETTNTEKIESQDLDFYGDHVTPSHVYKNHSAHDEIDGRNAETQMTNFKQDFNVDSTFSTHYVNTSVDGDRWNAEHPHQDITDNNAFKENLTDTALMPSSMYDSVEINTAGNNRENSSLLYEEINTKELYLSNTATDGLHISSDDLAVRATDSEEIHPRILSGLESTNVNESFQESFEKVNTGAIDADDFIADKYLVNESSDAYVNGTFHHLVDDQNTEAIGKGDHVFETKSEFNEAYISESAFDFLHQSHAEEHPSAEEQDEDTTASKYILGRGVRQETKEHHIMEVSGDRIENSDGEFNIEVSGREELHADIDTRTQYENSHVSAVAIADVHHFREEKTEDNRVESDDSFHENMEKKSVNTNYSNVADIFLHLHDKETSDDINRLDTDLGFSQQTEASIESDKVDQPATEIDLEDEIRKQHRILSPRLSEDAEYDKTLNFNHDINKSSPSSVSSIHSNHISDHRHIVRETAFNSEFFGRSHSSSDDEKQDVSRQNSVIVTAESSVFPREELENKLLTELQHKEHSEEHSDTVEEFHRTLNIHSEHSISSRSSVSSIDSHRKDQYVLGTNESFRLGDTVDTEKHSLPSTDSLLEADKSFHSNIKFQYEEESTDFGSAKTNLHKEYIEDNDNQQYISQDNFRFQDQTERNAQESDADFKSVKQTTEEYISMARLSQTLRSTSNDEESTKQKEDESHLFSRDKFHALRNVFEKQEETTPETSSFKTKRHSYKLGTVSSPVSESKQVGNWELNRQVSSTSSATSNDKKELQGYLSSAAQIDGYTSVESGSDRVIIKSSESDNENNQHIQNQDHKKVTLNKKLSYDLQTRELRQGSVSSASSIKSTSSNNSIKNNETNIHAVNNHGEGHNSNFAADDNYPTNRLFSQKPGLMNLTHWNTQQTYSNDSEHDPSTRRSSVSSDMSSASQREVAGRTTGEYHESSYKETSEELHSQRETNHTQPPDVAGGISKHSFGDDSSTEDGEEFDLRKRSNSSNSLSSNRSSQSSSLEIEDHSLFSQESVGRFSPSIDQMATHIQTVNVRDTVNVNSGKSSVRSDSPKRSYLDDGDDALYPSDNFSFRENNEIKANKLLTENVTAHATNQTISQSSDRGKPVRRNSSSGSEKETKLIDAFLRSGASFDLSLNVSRDSSRRGSVKNHQWTESVRQTDLADTIESKRRASNSSESTDSVKSDFSRRSGSVHSEITLIEAHENDTRNNEDLTSVTDHNTGNNIFKSEEAFTVMSHNLSQPNLRRHSLSSEEDQNRSDKYLITEEQNGLQWRRENDRSPTNVDDTPSVRTYVIKRSIANDLYDTPDELPHDTVFINSQPHLGEDSSRDLYAKTSPAPEKMAREVTEIDSDTQDSVRQRQWQSSFGVDSFNQSTASKKDSHSLENDRGYSNTLGSNVAYHDTEKRYVIKHTGLDSSPIFPSLFNSDAAAQQTQRYTYGHHDTNTYNGGYVSSENYDRFATDSRIDPANVSSEFAYPEVISSTNNSQTWSTRGLQPRTTGLYDSNSYSSSRVPFIENAREDNVIHLQSRPSRVVDTANLIQTSTSPGPRSATIHRNQHSPIEDRFQFTPITISTASQALVGDTVGVHIDFSPPAALHSPHNISSSSDEERDQQRFIVRNIPQKSLLKKSLNNSSSDIILTKEDVPTENGNQITNLSGSLSPRTVVDGPIYRTYQSQRSHLSRSLSSDNSLASHHDDNNDPKLKVYDLGMTNDDGDDQNGNLYRVLNLSPNVPESETAESERGRSRNRSTNFSDTKNASRTPRKHHSPERFFKNPTLSLRQEDYDNKGYSSDYEDGKHYQHVTKVYLSGETPRSRSQSPSTRYRVSSLQHQSSLEITRGSTVPENNTQHYVSKVRSPNHLRNSSPEISDSESHSGFQGDKHRYRVIGTSDSSLDKHQVRAQSSPKFDRKHGQYYEETAIARTESVQSSQLSNAPAAKHSYKAMVHVQVDNNITKERDPEDILNSRYMIKRVRSADDLRDSSLTVNENIQSSSDKKMWKTGRSRSTEEYLSQNDGVDSGFQSTGVYDLPGRLVTTTTQKDSNKMYVVNSTLSNAKDNHESVGIPHGWYTSTIDINERYPQTKQNLNESHHGKVEVQEQLHSPSYKTEKTVYISNNALPQPKIGNTFQGTREFAFHDHGHGTEIANSDGEHEHRRKADRFERISEDMEEPRILDYSRSTEDLSNDLRVLRGKILIKNRFDSSEFSEDDFDQNANLFDTSFHLGKDNPVYSSDPDIAASLRREEARDLSKHVTQDITFETVDRLAQQYKTDRQVQLSPGPQRKKPNLSSLLLSKLALVDSKDIRQTVDVEHHNEEVHGDIRFVHADGEQKDSKDTYNFDSVNEKVELTLTQGKANVIIKVIAERVVPTNFEFNVWRKSQAIVTRHIEIDLQANEQMKRLYKHVMSKTGNSGSLEGGSRLSTYNSATLSPQERDLSSMETLKLFTQILDVAEHQGDRDHADSRVRHDLGQLPASVMDMLY